MIDLRPYEGQTIILSGDGTRKKIHKAEIKRAATHSPIQEFRIDRARYSKAEDAFRAKLQVMMRGYIGGTIPRKKLIQDFSRELHQFQVKSYLLGKRTGGSYSEEISMSEKRYLHGLHSREMKFFHNFIRDVDTGSGKMNYQQRIDLYGLSTWGVYLRGFVFSFPPGTRWSWEMKYESEHCSGCMRRQAESKKNGGYTLKDLLGKIGFPGEKTPCGKRCTCSLTPVGYNMSFKRTRPVTFQHVKNYEGNRSKRNRSQLNTDHNGGNAEINPGRNQKITVRG